MQRVAETLDIKFFWVNGFGLANQTDGLFILLDNKVLHLLFVIKHPSFIINFSFSVHRKIVSNKKFKIVAFFYCKAVNINTCNQQNSMHNKTTE